jgi:hypothetical protein
VTVINDVFYTAAPRLVGKVGVCPADCKIYGATEGVNMFR